MQSPNVIVGSTFGFILLIFLEIIISIKTSKTNYEKKDSFASVSLAIGNLMVTVFTNSFVLLLLIWLYEHRLFSFPVPGWLLFPLCFIADDFTFYWMHRLSHQIRWFWASHSVHHSSEHFNLTAGLRGPWTGNISGTFVFWLWLPLAGFQPGLVLLMQSISLLYQFWIHTELIKKMPAWFEYIFNTPSNHRVHHGIESEYIDRNFGGTLILWDRIFGSFKMETYRPTYGLTQSVNSFNPFRIAIHEWTNLFRDLRKARRLKDQISYIVHRPGWNPDLKTSPNDTPEFTR